MIEWVFCPLFNYVQVVKFKKLLTGEQCFNILKEESNHIQGGSYV